jgi:catechol 2,3-dioxygenase-like lactoylglutathione lyase family enzyme
MRYGAPSGAFSLEQHEEHQPMKTHLGHLEVRVTPAHLPFYADLMAFLGWSTLYQDDNMLGVGSGERASLWFVPHANDAPNDHDGVGVNHIGIATTTQAEVDEAVDYLRGKGISTLFETPRHRPDFASSEAETYYQVMFESPDRILFEIVYTGPKA